MFRDYGRSLNHAKDPLPPRDDVVVFDVWTNKRESEKNLNLQRCSSDLHEKVKEFTDYWDVFCEYGLRRLIQGFSL